jgi:hypothetical protein
LIEDGATSGCVESETNSDVVPALLTPAMIASVRPSATGGPPETAPVVQ